MAALCFIPHGKLHFCGKASTPTRAFSPECLSSPGRGCDSRVTTAGWQQLMFLLCFQLFFGGSCPPGGGGELWKSLRPLPSLPLAPPSHQLGKSCCLNVKPPGATPAAPSGLSEVALLPRGAPRAVPALSLSPGCHLEPEAAQPWCCSLCDKRAVSLVNKWLLFLIPLLPNSFPPREGLSSALELPKTPGFLENGDFGVTSRAVPGCGGRAPRGAPAALGTRTLLSPSCAPQSQNPKSVWDGREFKAWSCSSLSLPWRTFQAAPVLVQGKI